VGKFWSLLFLLVPVLGVYCFIYGATNNIWLPEDISEHGHTIDHLFYFILGLTGVVFIGTELALFWFMWKYDKAVNKSPVKYMHGSHSLEVIWSIIPAATLLFIAIYQMNAWANVKLLSHKPKIAPTVEVIARQFEWRLRYPGKDNVIGTTDDVFLVNDLHLPVNEEILVELKSMDVLHSFFLPNMRMKQDAVPGMKIPVWFRATKEGVYDLVCAELCGWGHYKMKGRLTIESRAKYDEWLQQKYLEQEATQETQTVASKE
jgi:cytochrome c oxidase subunit 2